MLARLRSFLRVLRSRRDFEQGMGEELRFHIEQYTEDLIRSGVSRQNAERRAHIEFGGVAGIEEDCREARGLQLPDNLLRQLRHAMRSLRKTPSFTVTVLLTLAICLGANLTIFAVVDSILLRPLPFPDPDRLVTIFNTYPKAGVDRDGSSITNYYERRGRIPAFASLAIYRFGTAVLGEAGATRREQIARVSPEFFATLGVGPVMGRSFTEQETSFQSDKVVILTDSYWREQLNADPQITGKRIRVEGIPHTVVGVLPASFRYLSATARLYFPFSSRPEDRLPQQRHSGGNSRHLVARLKPGATLAQAQAQIDMQNNALEVDSPESKMMADAGFRSVVASLHGDHIAGIRLTLLWIQAGALTLLLIGAVNVTNLLLIRANNRVKEMAVRQALGASRLQVLCDVAVETTLLTLGGGILGLAIGAGGVRLLPAIGADLLPLGSYISLSSTEVWGVLLGTLALGFMLAVPIAWFNLQRHGAGVVQSMTRSETSNHGVQFLGNVFIVAQIALAMVLLAAAGLLSVSLQRVMAVSPGFRPDHVLTGQISVPRNKYSSWTARLAFNERLLREIARQPGVAATGVVNNVPLSGDSGKSAATVQGHVLRPGESPRGHYSYGVDGDYFQALGFRLTAGRFLTADDSRRWQRVCVVDEDFARYYWPHSSALGQHLFFGSDASSGARPFSVVGVVGAVKQAGLAEQEAQGAVYYPYALRTDDKLFVVVRTSQPPDLFGPALQRLVRQIDPELPVNDLRSMNTRISDSLVTRRSPALLAGIFSFIALLLTAVGTYGMLNYAVTQRRREIAVRMALGARPAQIRGQFMRLGVQLLCAGTILGIIGASLTGRAIRALLFQVPPVHLASMAAAVAIIGVVAVIACALPSHLAARTSPMEVLADQ